MYMADPDNVSEPVPLSSVWRLLKESCGNPPSLLLPKPATNLHMQSRRAHYTFEHKYGPSRLDGPTAPPTVSYAQATLGAKVSTSAQETPFLNQEVRSEFTPLPMTPVDQATVARDPQPEVHLRIPIIEELGQSQRCLTSPSPGGIAAPAPAQHPSQFLSAVVTLEQDTPEGSDTMEEYHSRPRSGPSIAYAFGSPMNTNGDRNPVGLPAEYSLSYRNGENANFETVRQPSVELGSTDVEMQTLGGPAPPWRIWNTTSDWALQYAVSSHPHSSSQFDPQRDFYFYSHAPVQVEPTNTVLEYTYEPHNEPAPSYFSSPSDSELRTPVHINWDTAKNDGAYFGSTSLEFATTAPTPTVLFENDNKHSLPPVQYTCDAGPVGAETVASDRGQDNDEANDSGPYEQLKQPGTPHPGSVDLLNDIDTLLTWLAVDTTSPDMRSESAYAVLLESSNVVEANAQTGLECSTTAPAVKKEAEQTLLTSTHETSNDSRDDAPQGSSQTAPSVSNEDMAPHDDRPPAPFEREGTEPLEEGEDQVPAVFLSPSTFGGDSDTVPNTYPLAQDAQQDPSTTDPTSQADSVPEAQSMSLPVPLSDPSPSHSSHSVPPSQAAPRSRSTNKDDRHSKRTAVRRPGTNSRLSSTVINDAKRMATKKESLEQNQAHIQARKRALLQSQLSGSRAVRPLPKRAQASQSMVPGKPSGVATTTTTAPPQTARDDDDDNPRPDRSDRKKRTRFSASDSQSSGSASQVQPTTPEPCSNKGKAMQASSWSSTRKPPRSILKNRNFGTSTQRPLPVAGHRVGARLGASYNHITFGASQSSYSGAKTRSSQSGSNARPVAGRSAGPLFDAGFGARSLFPPGHAPGSFGASSSLQPTAGLSSRLPFQDMFRASQQTYGEGGTWGSIPSDPDSEEETILDQGASWPSSTIGLAIESRGAIPYFLTGMPVTAICSRVLLKNKTQTGQIAAPPDRYRSPLGGGAICIGVGDG
ncbi:hypothetical protein BS17DRAFT_807253 [Gyrodon lividus]|nr:hypothetical protein BS17DRAFT_807253 [Gyrodon lividus]